MYKEVARTTIDLAHRNIVYPALTSGQAQKDREIAHERSLRLMERGQGSEFLMRLLTELYEVDDSIVATTFADTVLRNPLGLAAGFDKDVRVVRFLDSLGTGTIKVGSICLLEWGGNERPRVFILDKDLGLINRMGFPGEGADKAKDKLRTLDGTTNSALVVNIAASKPSFTSEDNAIRHYLEIVEQLSLYGEWHEVNVSSPNTPGVKGLQEPEVFEELASEIAKVYREGNMPFTFKFSPDLAVDKLLKDVRTAKDVGAAGVVVTNTTVDSQIRESLKSVNKNEAGGISGRPLTEKALDISHRVYEYVGEELAINRAGGVMISEDLWDALTYGGAKIVDIYTAFVYPKTSKPSLFYRMVSGLAKAMKEYGMSSMDEFEDLRGRKIPFPNSRKK